MRRFLLAEESSTQQRKKLKVHQEGDQNNENEQDAWEKLVTPTKLEWKKIVSENLDLSYTILFPKRAADAVFDQLEKEIEYYDDSLQKVQVFGKWHTIPRKQVAYGDPGLSYTFSGKTLPALPWTPLLVKIKNLLRVSTGWDFNFVLINRYKDGQDHIGEHRDDEKELSENAPIASLSFGQCRDFVFRHCDSRTTSISQKPCRSLDPVKIELQHGSLLLMNPPTNRFWYHSLPIRKKLLHPRTNLTFRKIIKKASF